MDELRPGAHDAGMESEETPSAGPGSALGRQTGRPRQSVGRWMWEWTKSIFIALLLFLFVRTFMVEAFQIPTASMENTLLVGDFLLVNKMVYGAEIPGTDLQFPAFDEPSRGDVIVFEPPASANQPPRTNYVKRIVGVGGDVLSMRDGRLFVNDVEIEETYAKASRRFGDVPHSNFAWQREFLADGSSRRYRPTRDNWGPLRVPEDHYFVLGDNRTNSEDSRYWGFVPREAVRGRPMIVYYSYERDDAATGMPWLTEIRWDRILHGIH